MFAANIFPANTTESALKLNNIVTIPRAFPSFTHVHKFTHPHIHQSQQFLLFLITCPFLTKSTITPFPSVELLNKAVHLKNKIKKDTQLLRISFEFACISFKLMIFSINCDRCFFLPFLNHYFTETIEFLVFNAVVVRLMIEKRTEKEIVSSAFE